MNLWFFVIHWYQTAVQKKLGIAISIQKYIYFTYKLKLPVQSFPEMQITKQENLYSWKSYKTIFVNCKKTWLERNKNYHYQNVP